MMNVSAQAPMEQRYFRISLHAIPPNVPIPCDAYIVVAGKLTLLRRTGETFTAERLRKLNRHEVQEFYAPVEQRPVFKEFLWKLLLDPTVPAERRAESVIEGTYLQAEEIDEQGPAFGAGITEMMKMLQKF